MQFFPSYPFSSPSLPVPQFHPSFGGPPHAEVYFGLQPIYEATSLTPSPHHLYWDICHLKMSALHTAIQQLAAFLPISPAYPSPTASTPEQIVHNRIPTSDPSTDSPPSTPPSASELDRPQRQHPFTTQETIPSAPTSPPVRPPQPPTITSASTLPPASIASPTTPLCDQAPPELPRHTNTRINISGFFASCCTKRIFKLLSKHGELLTASSASFDALAPAGRRRLLHSRTRQLLSARWPSMVSGPSLATCSALEYASRRAYLNLSCHPTGSPTSTSDRHLSIATRPRLQPPSPARPLLAAPRPPCGRW
jgi:hypothetical protein